MGELQSRKRPWAETDDDFKGTGPPDRWIYCPAMGKVISGFLPIKTPLSDKYDVDLQNPLYFFKPSDVFEYGPNQRKSGEQWNEKIGLWIDLTKTSRYYNKNEVESRGAKYVKMPLAGHGESPSRDDVDRFIKCVNEFRKSHPNDLIVVHCTHGFNRTGFLICAYICENEGSGLDFVVETFARARPDGIYKADYLADLAKMYTSDDELQCPPRPLWEREQQPNFLSWKSGAQPANGASSSASANGHPVTSQNPKHPQFMDGQVPSVVYVDDPELTAILRTTIRKYCKFDRDIFPGSQPVSLENNKEFTNITMLAHDDYMVSWKADGMRYLVLIKGEDQIYAFDRDNNVFELKGISFPHRKHDRHVQDTLVDAEMIIEHVPESSDVPQAFSRPRLLVYDIVKFEETAAGECDFRIRSECIRHELIEPREKAKKEGRIDPTKEPMGIRQKLFYNLSATAKLLSPEFTKQVCHEIDGLIFQPGYKPGRYDKLLKWKPQDLSTIDFKLRIEQVGGGRGCIPETKAALYVLRMQQPIAFIKAKASMKKYDGKIVECQFIQGEWKILRERTDKSHPNAFTTAQSVMRCIQSPITKSSLLTYIDKYCVNKKKP